MNFACKLPCSYTARCTEKCCCTARATHGLPLCSKRGTSTLWLTCVACSSKWAAGQPQAYMQSSVPSGCLWPQLGRRWATSWLASLGRMLLQLLQDPQRSDELCRSCAECLHNIGVKSSWLTRRCPACVRRKLAGLWCIQLRSRCKVESAPCYMKSPAFGSVRQARLK